MGEPRRAALLEGDDSTPHLSARIFLPADPTEPSAAAVLLQAFVDERCARDLGGYIWTREPLRIRASPSDGAAQRGTRAALEAFMATGVGSVDDEWLAVHLLRLATQDATLAAALQNLQESCGRDDQGSKGGDGGDHAEEPTDFLTVRVWDEDGEFLLIEGADALPAWIGPANARGRVWLYRGELRLIPPHLDRGAVAPGECEHCGPLADESALAILAGPRSEDTRVAPVLADRVFGSRMPSYPELTWASATQHRTLAFLPTKAARVLHAHPQLISYAAEALEGLEGAIDKRIIRDMTCFLPDGGGDVGGGGHAVAPPCDAMGNGVVAAALVPVRMTRFLYASMLSLAVFPSKRFGEQWRAASEAWRAALRRRILLGANTGASANTSDDRGDSADAGRRRDMGAKISMGLELLAHRARKTTWDAGSFVGGKRFTSDGGAAERRLIESLTRIGFFEGELPGSSRWAALHSQALSTLRAQQQQQHEGNGVDQGRLSDAVLAALYELEQDRLPSIAFQHFLERDGPQILGASEDPDDYFVEALLEQQADEGKADGPLPQQLAPDAHRVDPTLSRLQKFSQKMQAFVEGRGDTSGALFEDEGMDVDSEGLAEESESDSESEAQAIREAKRRVAALSPSERRDATSRLLSLGDEDRKDRGTSSRSSAAPSAIRPEEVHSHTLQSRTSQTQATLATALEAPEPRKPPPGPDCQHQKELRSGTTGAAYQAQEMRRMVASAKEQLRSTRIRYDGASDSEESVDEDVARGMESADDRRARARALDMEGDFEEDERERMRERAAADREDDEVAGADWTGFLDFARQSLGLTDAQYAKILEERRRDGRNVPDASHSVQKPSFRPHQLDTFDKVMDAMDDQLANAGANTANVAGAAEATTLPSQASFSDVVEAQDDELESKLKTSGDGEVALPPSKNRRGQPNMESILSDLTESFRSQAGAPGPASALAGRLGTPLPLPRRQGKPGP